MWLTASIAIAVFGRVGRVIVKGGIVVVGEGKTVTAVIAGVDEVMEERDGVTEGGHD